MGQDIETTMIGVEKSLSTIADELHRIRKLKECVCANELHVNQKTLKKFEEEK